MDTYILTIGTKEDNDKNQEYFAMGLSKGSSSWVAIKESFIPMIWKPHDVLHAHIMYYSNPKPYIPILQ